MPMGKGTYGSKKGRPNKYKSDFAKMSDKDFVKMSKTKQGKKKIKQNSCRASLMSRGYSSSRARQLCEQGTAKTIISDVKKGVKKVTSKLKKKK
tara:strand:+ start:32 stop:313 length:282 start_codon:yes stop_codon:yes gene_type:complete